MKRFFNFSSRIIVTAIIAITSAYLASAQALPLRKAIAEKVTGAWCQYCPAGITAFKTLNDQYPDDVITLAIHTGSSPASDAMIIPESSTLQNDSQNG